MSDILRRWGILLTILVAGTLSLAATQLFETQFSAGSDDGVVPTPLPASYAAGIAAAEQGDWSRAAAAFEDAMRTNPNAPPLLFALGTAYIESDRRLRGVIYLNAYLEAWPGAPNADAVRLNIKHVLLPYKNAAQEMVREAVAQLDGIADDQRRAVQSRAMAGGLIDLQPYLFDDYAAFASRHPNHITEATLDHLIARGTGLTAPQSAYNLLSTAIEAEAGAAADDVKRVGCRAVTIASVASETEICELRAPQGAVSVQACLDRQAGVGASNRPVQRGNRDVFAGHLSIYAAARLWTSGIDSSQLVRPLVQSHWARYARGAPADVSPRDCGESWPGERHGISLTHLADGSGLEPWMDPPRGRVEFSKPAPPGAGVPPAPSWHPWLTVVATKTIDVGPDQEMLAFDDPVFGDLAAGVRDVSREASDMRPQRLMSLASRLGFLIQRLGLK